MAGRVGENQVWCESGQPGGSGRLAGSPTQGTSNEVGLVMKRSAPICLLTVVLAVLVLGAAAHKQRLDKRVVALAQRARADAANLAPRGGDDLQRYRAGRRAAEPRHPSGEVGGRGKAHRVAGRPPRVLLPGA